MESESKYSQNEGKLLIQLARNTIQKALSKIISFSDLHITSDTSFSEKRGVFIGLWLNTTSRGCMGTPWPTKSLRETVKDAAVKAINDKRYPPVTREELDDIQVEVTILTTPKPIQPDQIKLGVHGLIIHNEEGSGLLLPQVPLDYGWNVKEFLIGTCLKGNIPINAWKEPGNLYAFEIQTFKEAQDS